MGKYLIVGGAGYIGSALAYYLHDRGHEIFILDNLSTGNINSVHPQSTFFQVDIGLDEEELYDCVNYTNYDAVFHFASLSIVSDSVNDPMSYMDQNFNNSRKLIDMCIRCGIKKFVFSSTANIFGNTIEEFISEWTDINPSSPYGESKLMVEKYLKWTSQRYGMNHSCLRYFNAAGAEGKLRTGELHNPETHLIPLIIDSIQNNKEFTIFGNDYNTSDGTCIRDYIHVDDLADAHFRVLDILDNESKNYNIGCGRGYSIYDIIKEVENYSGKKLNYKIGSRRNGDPDRLVASNQLFFSDTKWKPKNDISSIIRDAYEFKLL